MIFCISFSESREVKWSNIIGIYMHKLAKKNALNIEKDLSKQITIARSALVIGYRLLLIIQIYMRWILNNYEALVEIQIWSTFQT